MRMVKNLKKNLEKMAKEILTFTFSTKVYTQFIELFSFIQFKKANRIYLKFNYTSIKTIKTHFEFV